MILSDIRNKYIDGKDYKKIEQTKSSIKSKNNKEMKRIGLSEIICYQTYKNQ